MAVCAFNGISSIPSVGFGLGTAWFKGYDHNVDGSPLIDAVVQNTLTCLEAGFKHLDLAEVYGNDREVGVAFAQYYELHPTANREEFWITSKLANNIGNPKGGTRAILERLGTDYLDLLLLHCPNDFAKDKGFPSIPDIEVIWKQLEELVEEGVVKNIGVSNYRIQDLEELLRVARIPPVMNQVEFNPYLQQPELINYCQEHNIVVAAYSPLGPLNLWPGGAVDPVVEGLAAKYGVSTSHILLRYTNQKGIVAITTSSKRERMDDYLSVLNSPVELTAEEIAAIDAAGQGQNKRKYWAEQF